MPTRMRCSAVALVLVVAGASVHGQSIIEEWKLTGGSSADVGGFGRSVALSGTTALVGTRISGGGTGQVVAATLWDTETGDLLFELLADSIPNGSLGTTVALSGTTAVVGIPQDADRGPYAGAVYLFDTTTGERLTKLVGDDTASGDYFGSSVAISGTTLVVGANEDDAPVRASGSAYVFDIETGQQLFQLTANDGAEYDYFGSSVAIDGTTVVVGAWGRTNVWSFSGTAYIFDLLTGQQLNLNGSGSTVDPSTRLFGWDVAVAGNTVVVGAPGILGEFFGWVYVFDATTGDLLWSRSETLDFEGDEFGFAVDIGGDILAVGAPSAEIAFTPGSRYGMVYLYDRASGEPLGKLFPSDIDNSPYFGTSVSVSGSTCVGGAPFDRPRGAAFVFDLDQPLMPCSSADVATPVASLTFADVTAFLTAFVGGSFDADIAEPRWQLTFADITAFLVAFNDGCP